MDSLVPGILRSIWPGKLGSLGSLGSPGSPSHAKCDKKSCVEEHSSGNLQSTTSGNLQSLWR